MARFFRTLRHARPGARLTLLGKWFSSHRVGERPEPAKFCAFSSLATYETDYAKLGALLDQPGITPPVGEIDFLRRMLQRPRPHPGAIGAEDYFFLTAFASILAPRRVVELGTLTGFSAALLAASLARRHGHDSAGIDTIDTRAQCLIDETRPTGFEIAELIPDLASSVRLHTPNDSSHVRQLAHRDELELVFVDANHCHPYPLLDLLRVAPFMRGGGWIILHDIRLGSAGTDSPFGAEWLFQRYPWRKISGGNIGAMQVPADKCVLVPFALRLIAVPFEVDAARGRRLRSALLEALADLA